MTRQNSSTGALVTGPSVAVELLRWLDNFTGERQPVTNRQQHHLDALILMDEHVERSDRLR